VAFALPLFKLIHASTVLMSSVLTSTPAVGLVSEENTTSFYTVKNILVSVFSRSIQKRFIKPVKGLGFPEWARFLHEASQIYKTARHSVAQKRIHHWMKRLVYGFTHNIRYYFGRRVCRI